MPGRHPVPGVGTAARPVIGAGPGPRPTRSLRHVPLPASHGLRPPADFGYRFRLHHTAPSTGPKSSGRDRKGGLLG